MSNYPPGVTDSDPHFDLPNAHEDDEFNGQEAAMPETTEPLLSDESEDWIACRDEMPANGEPVATKIDDEKGVRNQQQMYFLNGLWWIGEGRDAMYVYYNPTHWRRSDD